MNSFSFWADSLADRASDPDIRKYYNPDEGPKHFIDLDSYSEFLTKGKIPENKDSAIKIYGNSEVIDHGILPWAIMASFDSLKSCFKRGNWQKAVIFASDLGHYVADAHNPLHLTVNYNGQLSGQTGIHSRYESSMISRFVANINLKTETVNFIPEVKTYVFNFIYENFRFKDSILAADLYATNKVGSTSSESYYNELWNKSGYLTGKLFNKASKRLMELIYTAWVEAGSPAYGTSAVQENQVKNSMILKPAIYLSNNTLFFHIEEYEHVNVKICNLEGQVIKTLVDEEKNLPDITSSVLIWKNYCQPFIFAGCRPGKS